MNRDDVRGQVLAWFERVVLGLNLCPFAHKPAKQGRVRFSVLSEGREQDLLKLIEDELMLLRKSSPEVLETTVIIAPKGFFMLCNSAKCSKSDCGSML